MKKCGFVIRVSTDRQARNKEGSLKNQLQRLQAHIDYKNTACGENWIIGGKYILKGVSGKDSFRSPEFYQLFADIKTGKINTIVCTALDRISRSVKDFLNFFEILNEHKVEFVCLKQNYDTTSSQGKLFITIMMALAEFERQQTSERSKDATMARADRGLWNGSQIIGYDLNPDRKGHIIPNKKENVLVNFAFDTYLKCGSLLKTALTMNEHGYRTKEYNSRRERFHPANTFSYSSVKFILTNYAYIGKREVNKEKKLMNQEKLPEIDRYKIVDAVWEPIISKEKFDRVQALIKKNTVTKHNQTRPIRHTYILNSGLLWCGKCGTEMEGQAGTGRGGVRYYYNKCKKRDCRFKVSADEIESVILERIRILSREKGILEGIIQATNNSLKKELPQLKGQKKLLQKELAEIKNFADAIINKWTSIANDDSNLFLKDKLDKLEQRRNEIEKGLQALELMIEEIERESVNKELVMLALNKFTKAFDHIPPYRQKELMHLILHKAILAPTSIKIALYGRQPEIELFNATKPQGAFPRSGTAGWWARLDLNQEPSDYESDALTN